MSDSDVSEHFPLGLSDEEKAALLWKVEQDYLASEMKAISFKDEYITFAINFYTRNVHSLDDVTQQYRSHCKALHRRNLAQAFMTDMKSQMRSGEDEMMM